VGWLPALQPHWVREDFSLPIKSVAAIFARSLRTQRSDSFVSTQQNRAGEGSRLMGNCKIRITSKSH